MNGTLNRLRPQWQRAGMRVVMVDDKDDDGGEVLILNSNCKDVLNFLPYIVRYDACIVSVS